MQLTPQIWVSIGIMVYYLIFQITDDVMRISKKTNSSNRIIERLRSEYKVTIRTFYAKRPFAFSSFRAIWLNERILKSEKTISFAFHHEYYHLKNKHKQWSLLMRIIISILPLSKYFVNWGVTVVIILAAAYFMNLLTDGRKGLFEKKANKYAENIISGKNEKTS